MRFAYTFSEGSNAGGGDLEFDRLNYIESTGTQYIDTGVVPNGNSGFYADFCIENTINASDTGYVFGSRETWQSKRFQLNTYPSFSGGQFGYDSNINYNPEITVGQRVSVSLFDGVLTSGKGNITTIDKQNFEGAGIITLFCCSNVGVPTGEYARMKLYCIKFYNENVLVRDFVPVRSVWTGEVGLLDKVSGRFFGNSGTGSFVAG